VLRIFIALKIHRPRPGLNPRTLDLMASTITTRPPRPEKIHMNDELEWMWKIAFVAQFKMLSQQLPGGTEESHDNLSLDSRSLG
jgi:hypothetical protein